MRQHFLAERLFDGRCMRADSLQRLTIDGSRIVYAGDHASGPAIAVDETVENLQGRTVMPGLIDIHVHLSYGNATSNEAMDMYAPFEYRTLRAMIYAQQVLAAGYTSIVDPTTTGRVSLSVRDAIDAGWYTGPRITSSGRQLTSRQGLADWYPEWIGVPETSIGVLVQNRDEAIEIIRRQVKDGVDLIKIDFDGTQVNPRTGHLSACFNQQEADAMVAEAHRLGRAVFAHAVDQEAVLYAARAGVEVIFHAYDICDEGLEAILGNGCRICPSLTFPYNTVDFTRPSDPCHDWRPGRKGQVIERAIEVLNRAREAGVPFLVGTDSGFAVTPYGEWHARELQIMVDDLGFSPEEALAASTAGNAEMLRQRGQAGELGAGKLADFIVVNGDPIADISILQRREAIEAVYLDGRKVELNLPRHPRGYPWEHSHSQWADVYTRDRVAEMREAAE